MPRSPRRRHPESRLFEKLWRVGLDCKANAKSAALKFETVWHALRASHGALTGCEDVLEAEVLCVCCFYGLPSLSGTRHFAGATSGVFGGAGATSSFGTCQPPPSAR